MITWFTFEICLPLCKNEQFRCRFGIQSDDYDK